MFNLKAIIGVVGTLFPVIFPEKEFKPKRLGAVIIIVILVTVGAKIVGVENLEMISDVTSDLVELTEEVK